MSPGFRPYVGATCGVTGYSWVGDITAGIEFRGGLAAPLTGGFCNEKIQKCSKPINNFHI